MGAGLKLIIRHDIVPGPLWERSEPPKGAARTQFNRLEKDNVRKRKIMCPNNCFSCTQQHTHLCPLVCPARVLHTHSTHICVHLSVLPTHCTNRPHSCVHIRVLLKHSTHAVGSRTSILIANEFVFCTRSAHPFVSTFLSCPKTVHTSHTVVWDICVLHTHSTQAVGAKLQRFPY